MRIVEGESQRNVNTKRYDIGSGVQARLSEWNRTHMSHSQQETARNIIKTLVRTSTDAYSAKTDPSASTLRVNRVSGGRVEFHRGSLTLPNGQVIRDLTPADVSVGSQVCAAVRKNLLPYREGETQIPGESVASTPSGVTQGESITATIGEPEEVTPSVEEEVEEVEVHTPQIVTPKNPGETMKERWQDIITYLDTHRDSQGKAADVVSTAAYIHSANMLNVGISVEAILHSYAMLWPEDARAAVGITHYDPRTYGEHKEGQHESVPYVEALIEAGVPVYMCGPSQSGKSTIARHIAENRSVQFRSTPCFAGLSVTYFFGRPMPNEYVSAGLRDTYTDGGVMLLDEMDASDATLTVLNDTISGPSLHNPVKDEVINRHPDFIPLAAGNTWGEGGDDVFVTRERLDGATLERFRMGRVLVDYDRDLQVSLFDKYHNESEGE